ncbi:LANO_0F11892g1_1 [Lachancea nothofagi CBS 11611]|uniref:LANO_0F11892g1_1 n=1 Tax=Lachancea nothofagi CBS 11611 TaxID=1266666 RepID=A0A1G4KB21_9SACH|nr:LANO_0F11892g1_1 [Lachancea nothofagi CBS 11611]
MLCDVALRKRVSRFYKKTPTIQFLKRVESRSRKPKRFIQPSAGGALLIRYGTLHGYQDLRALQCRYRGINHGDKVKLGSRCQCQTHALNPSPLHKDISRGMKKRLQLKLHS